MVIVEDGPLCGKKAQVCLEKALSVIPGAQNFSRRDGVATLLLFAV